MGSHFLKLEQEEEYKKDSKLLMNRIVQSI